jgi:hypothetical protein
MATADDPAACADFQVPFVADLLDRGVEVVVRVDGHHPIGGTDDVIDPV